MTARRRGAVALGVFVAAVALLWWFGRDGGDSTSPGAEAPAATVAPRRATHRATSSAAAVDPARLATIRERQRRLGAELPVLALKGRVVTLEGEPVEGARVVLASPRRVEHSDAEGAFEFPGLPPGRYTLEARDQAQVAGPIVATLTPETAADVIVLHMYGGHALEVEVVDAGTGRAVAGASVELSLISMFAGGGVHRQITGNDGVARFEGVTFVGHDLWVSAPGYADTRAGPGPDLPPIDDRNTRRMRVELQPGAEVRGRITGAGGEPLEGAVVEAVPYQAGVVAEDEAQLAALYGNVDRHVLVASGSGAHSAEDGSYRLGLAPGDWMLVASRRGHAPTTVGPVFASAGDQSFDIQMSAGVDVDGVVVDIDDQPVPGAEVEVRWQAQERVLATHRADGTGAFSLAGLPDAPLELIAKSDRGWSSPVPIDLSAGAPKQPVVVVIGNTGVITGVVKESTGAAIPDAHVIYTEARRTQKPTVYPSIVTADSEGRFVIRGVEQDAAYAVEGYIPGNDGSYITRAQRVVARGGQDIEIVIPAGGRIAGTVRSIRGAPVRRAIVTNLYSQAKMVPDAQGRFETPELPPGHYTLRVSGPDIADTFVRDIEVESGRTRDIGAVEVGARRSLRGVVVSSSGTALPEATVSVTVDGDYVLNDRSRAGGQFEMSVPRSAALDIEARHGTGARTAPVRIEPDQPAGDVRLVMLPGGTVRGTVVARGQAVADHLIMATRTDLPRGTVHDGSTITDAAGAFALQDLPEGLYFIDVVLPDDERDFVLVYTQEARVEEGKTVELQFDISQGAAGATRMPTPTVDELPSMPPSGSPDEDHEHTD